MHSHRLRISFVLAALCSAGSVLAAGAADRIDVVNPYVRLAPPAAMTTGAFMVLKNTGDKPVRLLKAESSVAKSVELHTHLNDNGVMKMRQVQGIDIPNGGETALKPGSFHIMLIDMKAPLKEGDTVNFALGFDDGSVKQIAATVKKPEAPAAEAKHDHSQHKH
jgi:copper(I)-binding protein